VVEQAGEDPNAVYLQVVVGELRPAWCDQCLTSAAFTFGVYILSESGPLLVGEGTGCPDCGTGVFADDETD
jgi:hypothetical protein